MPRCPRARCRAWFDSISGYNAHLRSHRKPRTEDMTPVCPRCKKNPVSSEGLCAICLIYRHG